MAITPDGKYFISAARDHYLKIWSIKTLKVIYAVKSNIDNINSIAASRDSKIIAVGNTNGTVQLWDLATRKLIQSIEACSPVIFSEDSKYLITSDVNNRIRVWQQNIERDRLSYKNYVNAQWWEVLGVNKNSSCTDIKAAYYSLVKQYHPDLNSTKEAKEIMLIINRAYQEFRSNYT